MQHIFPQNHRQIGADFGPAVMTTRTDGSCDQNSRVILASPPHHEYPVRNLQFSCHSRPPPTSHPSFHKLDPYAPGPSPRTAAPWLSPAVLSVPQSTLPWPGSSTTQAAQGQADQTSVFGHCQATGMPDDLMNMNSRRYLQLLDQHPHAAHSNPQAAHPLMPPLGAARFWDMGCYFGSHTPAMAHSSAGVGPHVAPTASRMPGYDGHIIGLGSIATNVLHHPVTAAAGGVDNHHQMGTGLPPPPPAHPAAHAATHHAAHLGSAHAATALAPPPPPPPPHVPVCSATSGVGVSASDGGVSNLKFYPGGAGASAAATSGGGASVSLSSEPSGSSGTSSGAGGGGGDSSATGSAGLGSVSASRPPPQPPHPSSGASGQPGSAGMSRPPHQPSSASAKRSSSSAAGGASSGGGGASSAAGVGDASGLMGGAERPFICETCNKGFTKEHHLKTHKRIHTGERPYGCDVCGKAFSKAYHLKRHKSIHTGERPFVCEDCGKAFSEAYYLKRHRSIHSGERPHACESCGKSFSKAYYLKRHQTIHTGERRQFYNMWSKGAAAGTNAVAGAGGAGGPNAASGSGAGPTDPGASSGSPLGRKPTGAVPLSLVGAGASASTDVAGQRPV